MARRSLVHLLRGAVLGALLLLAGGSDSSAQPGGRRQESRLPISSLRLLSGFTVSVFTADVPGARSLALSPGGVLYIGTRREGRVYAVTDTNRDGRADRVRTIARGLNQPNGVAWRDGALYVAEVSRILRFDGIDGRLDSPPRPRVVSDAFPKETHHGWKFIRFGPDGALYVPVGAPCNVCARKEPIFSTITRLNVAAAGSRPEIFARGIRNTVGFDWQPGSGVLWFTENGRDWLGDDVPPDELDRAPRAGLHFGFPHCHGRIPDPELGPRNGAAGCRQYAQPALELGPHVAALGMRFYTGGMFPAAYRNQVFFAEHGSWNRSKPVGYRVMLARIQGDRAVGVEVFAEGWLRPNGRVWGRPVDVEVAADGALLVSDDEAGAVYRIAHGRR